MPFHAKGKIVENSLVFAKINRANIDLCKLPAVKRDLDEFDLKLLEAIQGNSRLTADELAARVCLSPSSVQRRLRRLRERKVIEAEVAIVSPDALGRSLTVIVEVTLDTDRPKVVEEFQRAIQEAPEVMQGYYVTGNADYILVITVKNMTDYEAFACEFLSRRPHVKHFRTSIVMRRVKYGLTLPIKSDQQAPSG